LDDVSQFFVSRRGGWGSNPLPLFETSVLETGISAIDRNLVNLRPHTFLAIVPRSPFLSLGVETVKSESGFHVVSGRWE
jgi:hypothetical protein